MTIRTTVFLILIFCQFTFSHAQDSLLLSLDDVIRMAQGNSPSARLAQMEVNASKLDYTAFKAGLKPELSLSANLPGLSRSISNINQDDGSILFREQSQAISRVGVNLSQQLGTGGNLFVSSSTLGIFNFEPIDATNWRTSIFEVGFSQPIFQFNQVKWNKQNATINLNLALGEYAVEKERIALEITDIFFDALIAQENLLRANTNVLNNDTIFEITEGRFGVGKIAENELLQSELNLMQARSGQERAKVDLERAIRSLKTQLALPDGEIISMLSPLILPRMIYDPEKAVEEALKHSQFTREIALEKFRADQALARTKGANRPELNLNATFGLNQTAEEFLDTYRNPVDRQTLSMGVDVPIFNWGRAKAENEAALIRQEQTYASAELREQTFRDQVYYQVLTLKQLETQLTIASKSDEIAQKRYTITKNRYLIGKIGVQDLFIAQSENDRARADYLSTLRDYWTAYINLRLATLFDFVEMKPLME